MTANNGWPGKPGVPLNPEKDDWHWLRTPDGELVPYNWRPEGECEWGRWASAWIYDKEDDWPPEECTYLGPVLTPDEATALQKRCEEAGRERDALRRDASQEIATDELVRRLQHLGDWQAADRIDALQARVTELEGALEGIKEYWNGSDKSAVDAAEECRYRAEAALEGKKE
ncbi:MAG: hypothetical protein ACK5QX_11980 [bacterium]